MQTGDYFPDPDTHGQTSDNMQWYQWYRRLWTYPIVSTLRLRWICLYQRTMRSCTNIITLVTIRLVATRRPSFIRCRRQSIYSRTQLSVTDEHVIDHASLRYNDESCSSIDDDATAESILFSATASYRYGTPLRLRPRQSVAHAGALLAAAVWGGQICIEGGGKNSGWHNTWLSEWCNLTPCDATL